MGATAGAHVRGHTRDLLSAAGGGLNPGLVIAAGIQLAAEEAALLVEQAPAERFVRRPAGEAWSAAGVTGHLLEMLPYWADKARAVAENPALSLGRSLEAPERLGAVVHGEKLSPADAAERLRTAAGKAAAVLSAVPIAAWSRQVTSTRLGTLSLEACINQLVLQHAHEHVEQNRERSGLSLTPPPAEANPSPRRGGKCCACGAARERSHLSS